MTSGHTAAPSRPAEDDVTELVLAARGGDQEAWVLLVDRYARLVYAVALRCRLSHADAADVSQTVWLRLAENLTRINEPSRVGAWLVTTTRPDCLALIQARARYAPMDASAVTTRIRCLSLLRRHLEEATTRERAPL